MAKKISKVLTLPPILPTLAPEQITWLLKGQKSKGEELLKKGFLSLEDIQLWNATTKDILTKAFGSNSDYIDAILYAGNQRVFSMYEPESTLERQRRKNFQASLKIINQCIDQLEFSKEAAKKDINKKMGISETSESPKVVMIPDPDEEEKELEADEEMSEKDESQGIEDLETSEGERPSTAQVPDAQKKEFELAKELSKLDITKRIQRMEPLEIRKVPIVQGIREDRKKADFKELLSKPEVTKGIEAMETAESRKIPIGQGRGEGKKEAEPNELLSKADTTKRIETMETANNRRVFIVHGQDEEKKGAVAGLLTNLDLEPVILHEQPGQGMTLVEKFEHYSDVGFAVIILTGDDYGYPKGKPEESKPRPRQDVVFELGFLLGQFNRNCVCALHEEGLELPSDHPGAVFIPYDAGGLWKLLIARAMKVANVPVDLNKAV
jgi:predicted nucleotide-binding protein